MGKKSRRNRQKNPEQFKKNQQNAIKKQNTDILGKRQRHFRDVLNAPAKSFARSRKKKKI